MALKKEAEVGSEEGCCGVTACKYTLCLFNFIFLLSGCVVCGLGVWTVLEKGVFLRLMTVATYEVTAWLMVSTGCLAILTSLIGYTAVGMESRCLLATYTVLLVLVFMFESISGLLAYVYQEQIDEDLNSHLALTFIKEYGQDRGVTYAVDRIQKDFSCCGANSFLDWSTSDWRSGRDSSVKVPDSCCKTESPGCGIRDHPSNIPYTGCIHRFSEQLTQHLLLLGLVSLGLALLQVIGIILTSCLFSRLHKLDKYSPVRTSQPNADSRGTRGSWATA